MSVEHSHAAEMFADQAQESAHRRQPALVKATVVDFQRAIGGVPSDVDDVTCLQQTIRQLIRLASSLDKIESWVNFSSWTNISRYFYIKFSGQDPSVPGDVDDDMAIL